MNSAATTVLEVQPEEAGTRLDAFVAGRDLGLTRSHAEKLIASGTVRVDGRLVRAGHKVEIGERIEVDIPPRAPQSGPAAEPIPLEIIFEDDHLLVLSKPQGLVVHPGIGHKTGTLVNALLAHYPQLEGVGEGHRPGIVHRLDRDTSGLMVVAKTLAAFEELKREVRSRELDRRYLALVWGEVPEDRLIIEVPIGRRLHRRNIMAAVPFPDERHKVKSASTEILVLERFGFAALVEARLATGRTHQIRVHIAHQGYPVIGDPVYGLQKAKQERLMLDAETLALVEALPGQALHAHALSFRHPATGQVLSFTVPPPRPMGVLTARLRKLAQG